MPQLSEEGDKDERGRVLIVGGAREMPGALILAATAALRAGAGKLQIATCGSIVPIVAAAVPESRVFTLGETKAGAIAASAAKKVAELANRTQALLIGPGMIDEKSVARLVKNILPRIEDATMVLDAAALSCFSGTPECLREFKGNAVITPHAKEMAAMLDIDNEEVEREPLETARRAARQLGVVVALKGRETFIVAPDGEAYANRAGNVGLATSGSGDVLAGVIAGLA
ncbi:MAG: NAD(P)H-hydrate dehydratase, partial [Pyrinomonadaceae bacterium]